MGVLVDIQNNFGVEEDLTKKVEENYEMIFDDLHRIQMSLKENYETMMRNFKNHTSIPLSNGSITSFVVPSDDVPGDCSLVEYQLKV